MKSRIKQKSISGVAPAFLLNGRTGSWFFIALAAFILFFSLVQPQSVSGVRVLTTDIVTPVLSAFTKPFSNLAETISGVSGMAELRAENAQLKSENMRLKEWYQTALMLQAENKSLQELLNLKVDASYKYVTARVISDAGNAFVKSVLASVGSSEGVQKNQAALSGEGLIGRVVEAGERSSRILLLTDINSRIPVMIEGSRQKAIMAGNNTNYPVLKHLPHDAGIVVDSRVVTSGDGGVFPAGLPIGRITKDSDGNFTVKTYTEMNKVVYVRILDSNTNQNLILFDRK